MRYVIVVFFSLCGTAFAQPAQAEKEVKQQLPVTVYVSDHRDRKVVDLPADIDLELQGGVFWIVEMLEDRKIVVLNGKTVEIYADGKEPKTGQRPKIHIEWYQHGPGFTIPKGWRVLTGPNPNR